MGKIMTITCKNEKCFYKAHHEVDVLAGKDERTRRALLAAYDGDMERLITSEQESLLRRSSCPECEKPFERVC